MSEENPASSDASAAKSETAPVAVADSAAPAATATATKGKSTETKCKNGSCAIRRKFIWGSIIAFFGICLFASVRFFFPRALFEPKTRFTIGLPADFGIGVHTKFQQSRRIWVVRDSSSLYVIFARCTHLGCTPDWNAAENKFKCPCHGSGFDMEGVNFEGPAPKPLLRVSVELDGEGRIVVDKAKLFDYDQWKDDGAFLAV